MLKISRLKSFFFKKYLFITNVGLSATLSGVGDVIEQNYEKRHQNSEVEPKWDRKRTTNLMISGVTVGILCHYWYKYLELALPGKKMRIVIKKVLLDQIVYSPVGIFTLLVTLSIMDGSDFSTLSTDFETKGKNLYLAEWFIWPPAQFFNFYFIPPQYRVFYDNLISLGFDIYISHVAYKKEYKKSE